MNYEGKYDKSSFYLKMSFCAYIYLTSQHTVIAKLNLPVHPWAPRPLSTNNANENLRSLALAETLVNSSLIFIRVQIVIWISNQWQNPVRVPFFVRTPFVTFWKGLLSKLRKNLQEVYRKKTVHKENRHCFSKHLPHFYHFPLVSLAM